MLIAFHFLGWVLPAPKLSDVTCETLEELKQRYKSLYFWFDVLIAGMFFLLIGAYFLIFDFAVEYRLSRFSADAVLLWRFPRPVLAMICVFLSLASVVAVANSCFRLLLGAEEWRVFHTFLCHVTFKPRPYHVERFFHLILAMWFLLVVFTCGLVDYYAVVTQDTIVESPLFSLGAETIMPFGSVTRAYDVATVVKPDGKIGKVRHVLVVLSDGLRWSSAKSSFAGPYQAGLETVMKRLASHPHIQIHQVNSDSDVPQ
jgi:hypothetical protein